MKKGLRQLLSKRNNSGKLPGFAPMLWDMLNSGAYKELSYSTKVALIYFLGKPQPANIAQREFYEVEFTFTYSEAKTYGFSTRTFSSAIKQLVDKGFIDPIKRGGYRGFGQDASKFRMSIRWLDYGAQEFKEVQWIQFHQHK